MKKTVRTSASAFLTALIKAVPYKIHIVLTDNGIQFTFPPRYAGGATARYMTHMFDMCCRENGIDHRLTKIKHPWTNGQVERMNRTIKEATVKRYHYDNCQQLQSHLADFINAYNYGRRLKTLDLSLIFHPVGSRVRSSFDPRPFFGPPDGRVFRLCHDGGLDAPSRFSNVIGAFCPIAPCGCTIVPPSPFLVG